MNASKFCFKVGLINTTICNILQYYVKDMVRLNINLRSCSHVRRSALIRAFNALFKNHNNPSQIRHSALGGSYETARVKVGYPPVTVDIYSGSPTPTTVPHGAILGLV